MNKIKQFKATLIALGIWLACFVFYLVTTPGSGYATNADDAKTLGGFMSKCSGGVINYGAQGYRCDAYGPSKIASIVILIGIVSFIVAIVTFIFRLISKAKK